MATLKSIASGNWTDASTWALCNSTAEVDSIAWSNGLSTTYVGTGSCTPGAIIVGGICVRVYSRVLSPSGTMSVELYNITAGASVAGTEVTINVSDIEYHGAALQDGLWYYFKFASPVTLLAATNYRVRAKVSVSSTVTLYSSSGQNWCTQFVTTTTQAPAAGDKLIIVGDKLSAGSSNSYTVTMNSTTATDYGTGSTTLPSVYVGHNAMLSYGLSAATNYVLRISGLLIIGLGGTLNVGSSGTPIPADSTAVLEFDCAVDGDFGLVVYGGTVNLQGSPRTAGKNVTHCFLNTDETSGQTVLGVDTDTGWKAGDTIAVASTFAASSQYDEKLLASDATATTLTITAGLTYNHDGNASAAAEVMLLTRNVMVRAVSTNFMAYVYLGSGVVADFDHVDFRSIGANAVNKYGVVMNTTTGSVTINNCISRNSEYAGFYVAVGNAANITITDCDTYANTGAGNIGGFHVAAQTTNTVSFVNCWAMRAAGYGFYSASLNINITNCRGVSNGTAGFYLLGSGATTATGVFSGLYARSNSVAGLYAASYLPITISNFTGRRNTLYGINPLNGLNLTLESPLIIGNSSAGIVCSCPVVMVINNGIFAGETGYAAVRALYVNANSSGLITLNNCTSGVVSGVYTAHTTSTFLVQGGQGLNVSANNCTLSDPAEVQNATSLFPHIEYIALMNNDNVIGAHKTYFREGVIATDATIFSDASPSQRLTPVSAVEKLRSGEFTVAVSSGQTLTPSVKVRESISGDGVDYNGTRASLIVKANAAIGINADTLLATATSANEGAWEILSGTTATVTGDGVLKFIVECCGTTGWINIDDWSCSTSNDTKGQLFWHGGLPVVYGNNSSGGGSSRPLHPLLQQVIG